MKEVKLVERKSTARLLSLIGEIPELILNNDFISARDGRPMYYLTTGNIWTMYNRGEIDKNPLKNAYKLKLACDNGIRKITEESFCDLLEEHLYLVAKEKMEELLPQIQEHYQSAKLSTVNDDIIITQNEHEKKCTNVVTAYRETNYRVRTNINDCHDYIFEDKENLIVKKPKPWWETQMDYYSFASNSLNIQTRFEPYKERINQYKKRDISQNTGKTVFKTKEEAQSMCDKLNAVLKGE